MNKRVTIRDILNTDEFRDFVVLAGDSALDKEVHSITIMDSPNPFPWSVGGETVLSSGYIFKKHESEFEELIRKMSDAGIVALFIKLKRYFDYIPQNIMMKPLMASEDMSYYFQHAKGVYINMGFKNDEKGSVYFPHHEKFKIDEDYMVYGTAMFAQFALDFLDSELY